MNLQLRLPTIFLFFGRLTEAGEMALSLSLPRMEGTDLRPWVPPEHSLVISSARHPLRAGEASEEDEGRVDGGAEGAPASFLALDWRAAAGMARQKLQVRCGCRSRVLCRV